MFQNFLFFFYTSERNVLAAFRISKCLFKEDKIKKEQLMQNSSLDQNIIETFIVESQKSKHNFNDQKKNPTRLKYKSILRSQSWKRQENLNTNLLIT